MFDGWLIKRYRVYCTISNWFDIYIVTLAQRGWWVLRHTALGQLLQEADLMEWKCDPSTRNSSNKRLISKHLAMWALSARMLTPSLSVVQTLQRSYFFLIQDKNNNRWVHKEMPHLTFRKKLLLKTQRTMDHCQSHRKEETKVNLWFHVTFR